MKEVKQCMLSSLWQLQGLTDGAFALALQLSGLTQGEIGQLRAGVEPNTAVLCLALRLIRHNHPGALLPRPVLALSSER